MPVITEEDEGSLPAPADFAQLLETDLSETALAGSNDAVIPTYTGLGGLQHPCMTHPEDENCLCNGFMGDWDLPGPSAEPSLGLEEPDYASFEKWIPQFIRPEKPCDYCRSKRLNCYITRGEARCTPCSTLFRECSLTNTHTLEAANASTGYLLDTLHVVDEDACKEQGTLTGIKPLKSKGRPSGTSTPIRSDDAPGSTKRNGIRFPRHAIKALRDWFDAHTNNPYPTEDEKAELERRTELKPSQISDWLANARRRRRVGEKSKPKLCSSPSLRPTTPAIAIPGASAKPWDELDPFERWKHSPPENEPANITDIVNAVANTELPDEASSPSSYGNRKRSSNGSGFSNIRAPSTASFETGQTSSVSASTALSHGSSKSRGSFGSFSSSLAGKKDRRRRRKPPHAANRKPGDEQKRIFQCTFCTDTFKFKYDWTRHEKSLHISLEKWICAPLGPIITDPETGNKRCVYCDVQSPADDHLETHNHRQCEDKGLDARTFYRKDHLRQHLRLMHNCEMTSFMEKWKSMAININSRCGFCEQRFTVWQERVDHLTAHFRAGARMTEWKGCRGLDPAVAAQVTNAMPPYLIGVEANSPNPFSATDRATWRHYLVSEPGDDSSAFIKKAVISGDPLADSSHTSATDVYPDVRSLGTCWEILTVRLGKYANETAKAGIVLTDEMLQTQARTILYGSDDPWNQTAADNPEWLDLFKKAHGLDFIPSTIGGEGPKIPEDLETYSDLGLRVPFSVQLQAYNRKEAESEYSGRRAELNNETPTKRLESCGKHAIIERIIGLSRDGVLFEPGFKCIHPQCDANVVRMVPGKIFHWCTFEVSPEQAKFLDSVKNTSIPTMLIEQAPEQAPLSARAQGLSALERLEAPLSQDAHVEDASKLRRKPFLQRHRYELPRDRAKRYATITPAWTDSGMMPELVATAQEDGNSTTPEATAGATMMEFLGGDVGQPLPFSTGAAASSIPLPVTSEGFLDWSMPTANAPLAAPVNADDVAFLDRLIAETTTSVEAPGIMSSADAFPATSAPMALTTGAADLSNVDFPVDDFSFNEEDMNWDFDGVFDMPMDESFGAVGEGL